MNEIYAIKGINFDFRNKYKYAEETQNLKKFLDLTKGYIEDYLEGNEIIKPMQEKIKMAKNNIHFALTDSKTSDEGVHFGSVAFDRKTNEVIIPLRMVNTNNLVNNFELMKTMTHEMFHLFIEGEENVKMATDKFINSFNLSLKQELAKIWGVDLPDKR